MRAGARDAGLLYRPGDDDRGQPRHAHARKRRCFSTSCSTTLRRERIWQLKRGAPVSDRALEVLGQRRCRCAACAWDGVQQIRGPAEPRARERLSSSIARVRDGFIDIFEELGYGRIDVAQAGARLFEDMNRTLERVIR